MLCFCPSASLLRVPIDQSHRLLCNKVMRSLRNWESQFIQLGGFHPSNVRPNFLTYVSTDKSDTRTHDNPPTTVCFSPLRQPCIPYTDTETPALVLSRTTGWNPKPLSMRTWYSIAGRRITPNDSISIALGAIYEETFESKQTISRVQSTMVFNFGIANLKFWISESIGSFRL